MNFHLQVIRSAIIVGGLAVASTAVSAPREHAPKVGRWRAWLECPGGELPFDIELSHEADQWRAWLINGGERIEIPQVTWRHTELSLDIDYYDSKITAQLSDEGKRLDGEWKKRSHGESWTRMVFHAQAGPAPRFKRGTSLATGDVSGKWSVRFSSSSDPTVGLFTQQKHGSVTGTFLTTTGDYRYLAGSLDGDRLRLSCFDGAHAFLFDARLQPDGRLQGDFWSRDTWHETWTARRDPSASLPNSFALTKWTGATRLQDVSFPDADGIRRSMADPLFLGKARIIEVFGTWCPNSRDATEYLVELDQRYRGRGLAILALAFELTGDFKRDAQQVKTYAKRHNVSYPILIAGTADKKKAAQALPFLDGLKAYPTTIFLGGQGNVRGVYTGFSGPATGMAHKELRRAFENLIEEMLGETVSGP